MASPTFFNRLLSEVPQAAQALPTSASLHISFDTQVECIFFQAGVDITVIALWLGHESIQTTHGYIEADLAMKEKALKKNGVRRSKNKTIPGR